MKDCIRLSSEVKRDKYTDYIQDKFDLKISDTCEVEIPNKLNISNFGKWNIGVICGASGSGKSTILKSLGEIKQPLFDESKTLISNFDDLTPKEATMLLSSIGLSSVPSWIRPYNVLSNGEQYRARLAKILADSKNEIILVDEYTSVVDRNVAKSMSNALQKYIRRNNKRIILATCHYDIFDWLQPDWIYDLNKGGALEKGDCLRQRPRIELQVYRTEADTWNRFKKHHYMTQEMNKGAHCFCFVWEDKLVGFVSTLTLACGTINKAMRESRIVVLPDFQGLGIGHKISEFIGGVYLSMGLKYYTKTINPAIGEYRNKSNKWAATPYNGKYRDDVKLKTCDPKYKNCKPRASYCHIYVGEPIYGYENLMLPIQEMRERKYGNVQLSLF